MFDVWCALVWWKGKGVCATAAATAVATAAATTAAAMRPDHAREAGLQAKAAVRQRVC